MTEDLRANGTTGPTRRELVAGIGGAVAVSGLAFPMPALAQADPGVRIGRHASSGPLDHSTNNYWIETPEGVFVVDAQWTLPHAEASMASMREATGDKPIVGLLITHDHTDHYGGMDAVLQAARSLGSDEIPIYASRQTRLSLANDAQGFQANRSEMFGADFGAITTPSDVVGDGSTIDLGATTLRILERPLNEAPSTSLVYVEGAQGADGDDGSGALICGDLVYDRRLPIAREGFAGVENWLVQLRGLREVHGDAILHVGHGTPRPGRDVIEEQSAILRDLRDTTLRAVERDGRLEAAVRDELVGQLVERYSNWTTIVGLTPTQVFTVSLDWIADGIDRSTPPG